MRRRSGLVSIMRRPMIVPEFFKRHGLTSLLHYFPSDMTLYQVRTLSSRELVIGCGERSGSVTYILVQLDTKEMKFTVLGVIDFLKFAQRKLILEYLFLSILALFDVRESSLR